MARRILSPIDLRTPEQRRGISSRTRNIQAITGILETVGRSEKARRESQQLDRVATAIANGATTIEAINAAANQPPDISPGIPGIIQRIGGAFQPPGGGVGQGIQQSIIGEALKKALSPSLLTPEEQRQGALVKAGIQPRAKTAKQPFEPTREETQLQKDAKLLSDRDKEGNLKITETQAEIIRNRLRQNPALRPLQSGSIDDQFKREIKGKPKEKIGKLDKAFGKEAYTQLLDEIKDAALAGGATEESAEAELNRWWDEQVGKEGDDIFKEFIPRSEFQEVTETTQRKTDESIQDFLKRTQ